MVSQTAKEGSTTRKALHPASYFFSMFMEECFTRSRLCEAVGEDPAKFEADGYVSPNEQEKPPKNDRKYVEAVEKLNQFNRKY